EAVVVRRVAGATVVGRADLVPDQAGDLQAGLGARDVEEACAVGVADPDIFDGLWFRDDRVRSARPGNGNQSGRGSQDEALDVHAIFSSCSVLSFVTEAVYIPCPSGN